jgi:hypothetical protein
MWKRLVGWRIVEGQVLRKISVDRCADRSSVVLMRRLFASTVTRSESEAISSEKFRSSFPGRGVLDVEFECFDGNFFKAGIPHPQTEVPGFGSIPVST